MNRTTRHALAHRDRRPSRWGLTAAALACATLSACGALRGRGGSGGSSSIFSDASEVVLRASLPTKAYTFHDDNTADIYLTDLTDAELTAFFAPSADWSRIEGTLVQVHLFLDPKPGKTPIEPTAVTASIRYAIITAGQIGIYDGAGFMLPGRKPGRSSIDASISAAPMRLTRATEGFNDLFGAAKLDISFEAPLDERAAPELGARVDALAAAARPIREP